MLGLAPIVLLPGAYQRWGWGTLICVGLAGLVAICAARTGKWPRWLAWLLAAVTALLAVSALAGDAPLAQLFGRAPRYEGLVTLPAYAIAAWAAARTVGPDSQRPAGDHLLRALSLSSILLAGLAVIESFGFRPLETNLDRPGSLAGNATDQAILGAIFTAVLASGVLGEWRRSGRLQLWPLLGAAAGVVSVVTSASRAGVLALCIVTVLLALRFILTSPRRGRAALQAISAALAVAVLVLAVPSTRVRLLGIDVLASRTPEDRLHMWRYAWRVALESPWFGVGPSGFADAVTGVFDDDWFTRVGVHEILDSPHNAFVQALVAGGFIGVLLGGAIVAAVLLAGVMRLRQANGWRADLLFGGLVALPAAGIALLTHVTSPIVLVPLAMLSGILVAMPGEGAELRWPKRITAAAISLWLVLVLLSTAADAAVLDGRRALERGELGQAMSAFDRASALRPWDADVALIAAQSLGAAREAGFEAAGAPALQWAARAVDALPYSARAAHVAGMVAMLEGDFKVARDQLSRAVELSPADPRLHHDLGVALLVSGDPLAAVIELERALELAPDSVPTQRALDDARRAAG